MKSKIILIVIDAFNIGGAPAFMKQHVAAVLKLGYQVVIIGARGNIDYPDKYFPGAIIIELAVGEGYGSFWGRLRWVTSFIRSIIEVYARYDVKLLYSPLVRSFLVALLHPFSWRVNKLYAFCGDLAMETKSAQIDKEHPFFLIRNWLRYLMQYIVILSATKIVTFSDYAKKLVGKRFGKSMESKVAVIPGYIAVGKQLAKIKKRILSIVTISRYEPRKGQDNLLKAVSILRDKGIDFSLTFAGPFDSIFLNYFFEIYEKLNLFTSVSFVHKVSDLQMKHLLLNADLCVVPSKDLETFGLITLIALSHGVPVIGTPTGSTPEILLPIDKHLVARSISPQAIADSIIWYKSLNYEQRLSLRRKIISHIRSNYDPETIEKKIIGLFKNILTPKKYD